MASMQQQSQLINNDNNDESGDESGDDLDSIYRTQKKIRTNDNTVHLMKRAVKDIVWIEYKFISLKMVNMIEFSEKDTILYKVLTYLNRETNSKSSNAQFFNTYGKYIPEVISQYRSNAVQQCKLSVVKGELKMCWYFGLLFIIGGKYFYVDTNAIHFHSLNIACIGMIFTNLYGRVEKHRKWRESKATK